MAVTAEQIRIVLSDLATRLEPNTLDLETAKSELRHFTAIKNIAATLEARTARRVADTGEARRNAFPSAGAWHGASTGTTAAKAQEQLDTAGHLEGLDEVAAAANAGELSPEQVAIIADGAKDNPDAQSQLLHTARTGSVRELRIAAQQAKAAADGDDAKARHDRIHRDRKVVFGHRVDGTATMFAAATPEQMAVIKAAVEKRTTELFHRARREGRREPREAYAMDALAQIAHEWHTGTPLAPARDEAAPAKKTSSGPPWLGMLRIDVEALVRGKVEGDEVCEIAGIGAIPAERARELLGDAVLKLVITNGVDVANVTHLGRGPTIAQKIALLWQDPVCGITKCPRVMGLENHHIEGWAATHVTELGSLGRRCDYHHDQLSKGWAEIHRPDGTIEIVPPEHPEHPDNRPRGPDPPLFV